MQLSNPSVTSPRLGDRSHRQNRNPRDLTGKEYQRQHAEQDAKKAAANLDVNEVKRQSFEAGRQAGYEKGLGDGWDACISAMVAEGILEPDEPGDEDQGDEA